MKRYPGSSFSLSGTLSKRSNHKIEIFWLSEAREPIGSYGTNPFLFFRELPEVKLKKKMLLRDINRGTDYVILEDRTGAEVSRIFI